MNDTVYTMTFEESLKRLEEIVHALENGDIFSEKGREKLETIGVKLSAYCNTLLETAEQKVSVLTKRGDGAIEEAPMAQMQNEYV